MPTRESTKEEELGERGRRSWESEGGGAGRAREEELRG